MACDGMTPRQIIENKQNRRTPRGGGVSRSRTPERIRASALSPEKVSSHTQPKADHHPAHYLRIELTREARSKVAADRSRHHHQEAVLPQHLLLHDKDDHRNAVSQRRSHDLERIDLVDILDPEDRQQRNDQKSSARPEVSDVEANHDHADKQRQKRWMTLFLSLVPAAPLQPAGNRRARRKQ